METVKISSKGRIVIPKSMRDSHQLQAGVEFIILEEGNSLRLVPTTKFKQSTVDEVGGILHRAGRSPISDDDMRAVLRAKAKASDDTNILSRFLLRDDEAQYQAAAQRLEKAQHY